MIIKSFFGLKINGEQETGENMDENSKWIREISDRIQFEYKHLVRTNLNEQH